MSRKLITLVLATSSLMAVGADFRFNSGGSEGWTYRLANVTTGVEIRTGSASWDDRDDHPRFFSDPTGDNHGAAYALVLPADYGSAEFGESLILQLISPDLTSDADWQTAQSFSARLALHDVPVFTSPAFSANMVVFIDDLDLGHARNFASGIASPVTPATWSYKEFDIASFFAALTPPVVHYRVTKVVINFFIAVSAGHTLSDPVQFDIDNVFPHCAGTTFSDETPFRTAAGPTTTYGFETHALSGMVNDLPPSPIPASNFAGDFDLAYVNLDGLNVSTSPGSDCNADGDNALFTHSVAPSVTVRDYSLTFSNFGGENRAITAFGLTLCDFASNINVLARITYDTGTDTGTLLAVPNGQGDNTHNFVGVVVCPNAAFTSITLTLNDNSSGFQWFDRVIYSVGPLMPLSLRREPNSSRMTLKWSSSSEKSYTVLTSSNLLQWASLTNLPGQGPFTTFTDQDTTPPIKFYRIRQGTNSNGGN